MTQTSKEKLVSVLELVLKNQDEWDVHKTTTMKSPSGSTQTVYDNIILECGDRRIHLDVGDTTRDIPIYPEDAE